MDITDTVENLLILANSSLSSIECKLLLSQRVKTTDLLSTLQHNKKNIMLSIEELKSVEIVKAALPGNRKLLSVVATMLFPALQLNGFLMDNTAIVEGIFPLVRVSRFAKQRNPVISQGGILNSEPGKCVFMWLERGVQSSTRIVVLEKILLVGADIAWKW
ncbi:hypothetical protein CB1_002231012 [Camelus ferus]|nr:hypothetical protein CB1_002231012 [Camelus ferus]